ncbi:MAG TPA: tetratricopeptide repeat protein, partial [Chthoniobacterales bacterium]
LRKDPDARFRRMEELLEQLRAARAQSRWNALRRWHVLGAAALLALIVAAAVYQRGPASPPAAAARPNETSRKSIAVLPFADLSPERDQQYFSDGIAEEILNALAHVKDLKVAGRSSSFSFRGKNEDVRSIAAALGVAHVLEGSVRKQGEKVRITAQLVQASDGFHIWSETYDGELSDVFRLQERIARAITNQLQVVLQGTQKSQLVKTATTSLDAYALFLQATSIFNRRDSARFLEGVAQLQEAVRLDSMFARAHARLASLCSVAPNYDVQLPERPLEMVTREARIAIELDPTLAEPHAALGQILFTQRRYTEARSAYERALVLDADDSVTNFWLASLLSSTGFPKASAQVLDKLLARDPMLPNALLWRGWVHLQRGEIDAAELAIRRAADAGLSSVGLALAQVAQARRDDTALVDWLARGLQPFTSDFPAGASQVIARGVVGTPDERARALAVINQYVATQPPMISGAVPLALMWLGEPARALAIAEAKPTRNDTVFLPSLWTAAGREARALPQFAAFAQRTGLAEFWDKTQPPEVCRKRENGGYFCGDLAGAAAPTETPTAVSRATGVAVSAREVVYAADFARHTIAQIAADGVMHDIAGAAGEIGSVDGAGAVARFHHPADLVIDREDNIYVADTNNHLIRKITPAGVVTTLAGGAAPAGSEDGPANSARFKFPTGLCLDRAGNLYVADYANHTVRKITPAGIVSTLAGLADEHGSNDGVGAAARFNHVHGVAVDGEGTVYAADFGNHTIRKITAAGTVTTLAGLAQNPGSADGTGAAARFCAPYSVDVDEQGNVYVADTSNQTIRKITPAGAVSTLAGLAGNVGNTDGSRDAARFAVPADVAVNGAGDIYVADFGNQAVRRITPDGLVSTFRALSGNRPAAREPAPLSGAVSAPPED